MLIFPASKIQIDKWIDISTRLSVYLLGAACLFFLFFFFCYPWTVRTVSRPGTGIKQKNHRTLFAYESIGMGGLALHPHHALGWISRLADEMVLISYNGRPDVKAADLKLLISLKTGKELLTLPNGKVLFLKEAVQGKGLFSSEVDTGLWVKPILLENGTVLVEAGRRLVSKEGLWGEEKGDFILSPQGGIPSRFNPVLQPFIKELKAVRGFAQDLLIQKYGGREYASWGEKITLEFTSGAGSYCCFVSAGDYLLYDRGEWRNAAFQELSCDRPLAYIKAASVKGIEIEAWDETGFYPIPIKIEIEKPARFQVKPETMPTAIRLRNANVVSCAFGKRRVLLKQGDWLLKTSSGWRNLRRSEEIDQYLHHRLKGELFIFDAIEKEQGRQVLKGHLFDESRTQMQPIALPIEADKIQGKASRKRKPFSANERRAA